MSDIVEKIEKNYEVSAFENKYYCKVITDKIRDYIAYTFLFGGKDTYCFIVAMKPETEWQPYIDRIEFDEKCMKNGLLEEQGGTTKLVKAALYTLIQLFDNIHTFTFIDDSYINCKRGDKRYRISMAYESILKHNKTYYEKNFNAQLAGDEHNIRTLKGTYKRSLRILDLQLEPFEHIIESLPELKKYEQLYKQSNSPRKFINAVRLAHPIDYCYEVESWLTKYIQYLRIIIHKESWFIDVGDVTEPAEYSIVEWKGPLIGGQKRRQTMKTSRSMKKRMVSERYEKCIGFYGEDF